MKLPRRKFLHLAVGAAALPVVPPLAWAQTYPTRPVRIIVGFGAGSASDILARLISEWLSERLGQQFIIDNRPGAGSNTATEAVVKAPPDGHVLLLGGVTNAINASLYEKLSYNFLRDIEPVAGLIVLTNVMVVNPRGGDKSSQKRDLREAKKDLPMTDVREFDAAYHLDNPEVIAAYLGEAFETGDSAFIAHAIRTIARARGMDGMAKKLGMSRSGLYKALSPEGNPSFAMMLQLLNSLGMGVNVRPQASQIGRLRSAPKKVSLRAVKRLRPAAHPRPRAGKRARKKK
jgi:probable addiction module antidote protein